MIELPLENAPLVWLMLGAVLAVPYVLIGRRLRGRTERLWWATGLVIAAGVYVAFTLARNAPWLAVAFETVGVLAYARMAILGVRGDRRWLAVGWLLHPLWDLMPHLPGGVAFAPAQYVWACTSFDLIVSAVLWWTVRTSPGQRRTSSPPSP